MNNIITFSLLEKIEKAAKDHSLFDGCRKILVGLSGGADSTCLLRSIVSLSQKYGFEVYALHVNHMIRGEEADRDELFARELCEKLNVTFFCERIDVPAKSKEYGQSLELCARNERYSAFITTCRKHGISHVATAHNSGDNAETVLFNLIRGSAAKGLCGIPPKRKLAQDITLVRPLIYVSRTEIEEYLSLLGQNFVTDSTNSDCDYTRNLIRNKVLPLLSQINPNLEESIMRAGALLKSDEEYLSGIAEISLSDELENLCLLDRSILSRVIRILFSKVSDEMPEEKHITALCEKIYSYRENKHVKCRICFPDRIEACIIRGRLYFEKADGLKECNPYCVTLSEGMNVPDGTPFALYISFDKNADIPKTIKNKEFIYKKVTSDYLYFDRIPECLTARSRQSGDKIRLNGMSKSLKRLMNEAEIPEKIRFSLPVICEKDEIIFVPYTAICDRCRKGNGKSVSVSVSLYTIQ